MKNIYLIGMPGSGKSTIGKILANVLDMKFYDMDDYIENISSHSIPELFDKGEPVFRMWESVACIRLSAKKKVLVACGGGVVTEEKNIESLSKSGLIIYIKRPLDLILRDIDFDSRPLLKEREVGLSQLFGKRKKLYEKAAHIIVNNNDSVENLIPVLVEQIMR